MTDKKPWERGPFHYESYDMFYRLQDGQGKTVEPLDVEAMADEIKRLRAEKNSAYTERNKLVAALSKCFPSYWMKHEGDEWDDDWRTIVCIELPSGQATWHIHDSECWMFSHLKEKPNNWDGHTTEQKYYRLAQLGVTQQ